MEDQSQAEEDEDGSDDEDVAEDKVENASESQDEVNKDHSKGHPESKTYRKHLAILRTNHQIHSEAADLFYSELTILLEPSNVTLREDLFRPFEYGRSERVWRHDPLLGIGDEDKDGQHFYDSHKLNGVMEPYVFARLRNISFHAMFVIPKTTFPFIHEDLSIDKDDEDKFTEYRGRTNIIRSFIKMISFSSTIILLNVHLGFQVNPFFPGVYASDFPYLSKDEFEKLRFAHDSRYIIAACRRATELFVDSGALDPLYGAGQC